MKRKIELNILLSTTTTATNKKHHRNNTYNNNNQTTQQQTTSLPKNYGPFSIFIFDSLSIRVGAYILSVFLIVFLYRKDILMSYREYLKPMFNKAES